MGCEGVSELGRVRASDLRSLKNSLEVIVAIVIRSLNHITLAIPEEVCCTGWLDALQCAQNILGQRYSNILFDLAGSQRHSTIFDLVKAQSNSVTDTQAAESHQQSQGIHARILIGLGCEPDAVLLLRCEWHDLRGVNFNLI